MGFSSFSFFTRGPHPSSVTNNRSTSSSAEMRSRIEREDTYSTSTFVEEERTNSGTIRWNTGSISGIARTCSSSARAKRPEMQMASTSEMKTVKVLTTISLQQKSASTAALIEVQVVIHRFPQPLAEKRRARHYPLNYARNEARSNNREAGFRI